MRGTDPLPSVKIGVRCLAASPWIAGAVIWLLYVNGVLDAVQSGASAAGLSDKAFWATIVFSVITILAPWQVGWIYIASPSVGRAFPGCEQMCRTTRGVGLLFIMVALSWSASIVLALSSSSLGLISTLLAAVGAVLLVGHFVAAHLLAAAIGEATGSVGLERAAKRAGVGIFLAGALSLVVSGDMSDRLEHETIRHWLAIILLAAIALVTEAWMLVMLLRTARARSAKVRCVLSP